MGSLSSRVLRHQGRARAQQESGSEAGGSARRLETGGEAAGHGFYYCPGSRKRKRSSGALCYCHPDSETDEEEEEGDEQQRLLNTPRRYVAGCARTCWVSAAGPGEESLGAAALSQPVRSGRVLDRVNVGAGPMRDGWGTTPWETPCFGLETTDAAWVALKTQNETEKRQAEACASLSRRHDRLVGLP